MAYDTTVRDALLPPEARVRSRDDDGEPQRGSRSWRWAAWLIMAAVFLVVSAMQGGEPTNPAGDDEQPPAKQMTSLAD